MAARFRAQGHEIVPSPSAADLVVVNTCAVTSAAEADSRKSIRHAARAGAKNIIATGCYATISPQAILDLPGVVSVITNEKKESLVSETLQLKDNDEYHQQPRLALPGKKHRTRAFIKVQEGCDNSCTFCVTRIARGKSRSKPLKEIFGDIESALWGGAREVVLTGVNLGSWGRDFSTPGDLAELVTQIINIISPPRIRLSSLEPWDITEDFFQVLNLPGFCRHLHIPLQSGCDQTLNRMGRRFSAQLYKKTIEKIRAIVPDISITTDIMVGFPGETDNDHHASLAFVEEMHFAGGHVFNYSIRPQTKASLMKDQISVLTRKKRSKEIREILSRSRKEFERNFIGKYLKVLWEKFYPMDEDGKVIGWSDNYIKIMANSEKNLQNMISTVKINDIMDAGLIGRILD